MSLGGLVHVRVAVWVWLGHEDEGGSEHVRVAVWVWLGHEGEGGSDCDGGHSPEESGKIGVGPGCTEGRDWARVRVDKLGGLS